MQREIVKKKRNLGSVLLAVIGGLSFLFPLPLFSQEDKGALPETALLPCTGGAGVSGHFRGELSRSLTETLYSLGIVRLADPEKVREAVLELSLSPSDYEKEGGVEVGRRVEVEEVLVCRVEEHTDGQHYLVSLIARTVESGETRKSGSGKIRKVYQPGDLQALSEELICEVRTCERIRMLQRKRVLLVVDSSNSLRKMGGNDVFNRRKSGAKLIYHYIKRHKLSNIELGVIDFSDRIHFALCPKSVFDFGEEIESAIERIGDEGGETNFDLCLREALKCLEASSGVSENFVFFLTDGFHNTGIYQSTHQLFNPRTNPSLQAPIPIYMMGLGADVGLDPESERGLNAFVLSKIAQESGQKDFVPIYSADDIQSAFVSLVELEVMLRKGVKSDVLKGVKKGKQEEFEFKGGGDIFIYIEEKSSFAYEINDPRGNRILIASTGDYHVINPRGQKIPNQHYPPVEVEMFEGQAVFIRIASGYHGDYRVGVTGESGIPKRGTNLHYMVSTAEDVRFDILTPRPGYVHENKEEDIRFQLKLSELPAPVVEIDNRVTVYRNNLPVQSISFDHPPQVTEYEFVYSGTRTHGGGFYRFKFESKGRIEGGASFQRFRESHIYVPDKPMWLKPILTARVSESCPQVHQVPKGLERVYFEFDSYEVTDAARDVLESLGRWLLAHPTVRIRLEGRCDDTGTEQYNLDLGADRANTVKRFLVNSSPEIDPGRIEIISRGKEVPLIRDLRPAYRWVYRRVDVVLAGSSKISRTPE